jgi:phosphate transport system substrate-binding protein
MTRIWAWCVVLASLAGLGACGGDREGATPDQMVRDANPGDGGMVTLTGAGATFPYPIYSKWFDVYSRENPVRVNYQPIGSGGGIRQITEGTVDFGGSDAPMTTEELAAAPSTLNLPTVLGAVAVAYNVPGLAQPLRLDGRTIADIFLGKIKRWNDPRIAQLNPGVPLPDRDILVVHRTDGSGTTYVFTEYLGSISPEWQNSVGVGKSVKWPTGLGAKGNEGVAGQLKQTEGAITYVEQAYAKQNNLSTAAVRNREGQFVMPTVEATTAAAAGVADQLGAGSDFRVSIVNPAGAEAYPIASWTYLLVPSQFEDCTKARALAALVRWALTEGGSYARELDYAPLPDDVRERVLEKWRTVTCGPNREPVMGSA